MLPHQDGGPCRALGTKTKSALPRKTDVSHSDVCAKPTEGGGQGLPDAASVLWDNPQGWPPEGPAGTEEKPKGSTPGSSAWDGASTLKGSKT